MKHQTNHTRSKYAYGTFLFKDGGYLPGVLLLAYKLRKLNTHGAKLICCYTADIDEHVVDIISPIYDYVQPIDYLKFGRDRLGRQAPLPYMPTRFRLLQLVPPHFNHAIEKVIALDADMLPLTSFDSLFDLPAPAGVINEDKDFARGDLRTAEKLERWEWHKNYENVFKPGELIPKVITDRPLARPNTNMGINGGLMLLEPSEADFKAFCEWCQHPNNEIIVNKMNWPDMQSITAYYSGRWTGIDAQYLGLYGYPNVKSLKGIHFIGPKPWQWRARGFAYRLNNYADHRLWAEEYLKMCEAWPELLKQKQLLTLKQKIKIAFSG